MNWEEIKVWRKKKRELLVARREAIPAGERKLLNERITSHLLDSLDVPHEAVVAFCWPYRAEFDARFAGRRWRDGGAITALPEVVGKGMPLQFRLWSPGVLMRAGVYDIPVPDGTEIVVPDMAVVPMNGFDARGYRLGYGGGFFDRTLAAAEPRPVAIGVSYEALRLETIFPQPHDVPMDFVVTESGVYAAGGHALELLSAAEARARSAQLFTARAPNKHGYSSPACYAAEFPGYFGDTAGTDSKK
jgi:5,10-methenyltetrahydrofolate synthetase